MAAIVDGFPLPKYYFDVDISGPAGVGTMSFQEVTGLDQEFDNLTYRHGDDDEMNLMKRVGLEKTGTVSLKRGVFSDVTQELPDYMREIFDNQGYQSQATPGDLLTITINLLDEKGATVITWTVEEAIPVKLVGTTLKSDENAVSIEQMDFMFRRLRIQ